MKKVIPAILAENLSDFEEKHRAISSFSDEIQIDVADDKFVENTTVSLEEIKELDKNKIYEAHLMVDCPLELIEECKRLGISRVAIHLESGGDMERKLEKIKEEGFEAVLAINPETNISDIDIFVKYIDRILLMSVNPGFGGQKLIKKVLDKAKKIKRKYPDIKIEMDGGINKENVKEVFDSGVDFAIVGSGILKAKNPKEEWESLNSYTNDNE